MAIITLRVSGMHERSVVFDHLGQPFESSLLMPSVLFVNFKHSEEGDGPNFDFDDEDDEL